MMNNGASFAARGMNAERRFYSGMAIVMILSVFLGFSPTFFLRPVLGQPQMLPLTPLVYLHGAVFTSWALLFLTQVGLVAAGRRDIHRRLGMAAIVLAAAMAVTGTLAGLYGVHRASGPPGIPPLAWSAVPLLSVPAFTGLIVAGLLCRAQPQTHKRLMLLSMIVMMSPSWGRIIPNLTGQVVLPSLFVLILALWDWKSIGRLHRATIWGGAAAIASFVLPLLLWQTGPWLAFAQWASALVG